VVSRTGIIPISASQDTAGPMTRTVADAALLLSALAGIDPSDAATHSAEGRIPTDYSRFLDAGALKGKRFGLVRQAMGHHPDVDALTQRAVALIKEAGADVIDVTIATFEKWNASELEVLLYEFKDGVNRYLAGSRAPQASLEALIAWNTANAARVMPHFGQELFERAQAKGPLTDAAYLKAKEAARRLAGAEGLVAALQRDTLDALVAPTMSPAWPTDHVLGDHFVGMSGYGMAAVAGTPSLTVPIGDSHGLPVGLTFMGGAYSESDLIGFGYALERTLQARRPPQFKPTIESR
jgi:amidase